MKSMEAMNGEALPENQAIESQDDARKMFVYEYADYEAIADIPEGTRVIYRAFDEIKEKQLIVDNFYTFIENYTEDKKWPVVNRLQAAKSEIEKDLESSVSKTLSKRLYDSHGHWLEVTSQEGSFPARVNKLNLSSFDGVLEGEAVTESENFKVFLQLDRDNLDKHGLPKIVATKANSNLIN